MNIRTIKNYLRNRVWVFLKARWKLRSGLSMVIANDNDWFVFNEIFTNKEYDRAFAPFFKNLPAKPLIIDLGANVGYFTLRIADELEQAGISNYRIISVEASATNYAVLSGRLNQPKLQGKADYYFGLAGHKTGKHAVVEAPDHFGHSAAVETAATKKNMVDYLDIESLVGDTQTAIDLLKCDIEGSEEIFIKAYPDLLTRVKTAVFEFHARECNVANCRKLLEQAGLFSMGIVKQEEVYQTSVEIFSRQ